MSIDPPDDEEVLSEIRSALEKIDVDPETRVELVKIISGLMFKAYSNGYNDGTLDNQEDPFTEEVQ